MKLFDLLLNDILSIFIDIELLSNPIGIAGWSLTYLDIFKFLYVSCISYFVVWFFVILPIVVLKKIMRYKELKGGKR